MSNTHAAPRVIWSVCHTGGLNEQYVHRVIDRAADEGVSAIELSGLHIDRYIQYVEFPALRDTVDSDRLRGNQQAMHRMVDHAKQRGLRFGLWHHEITGPSRLLDLMPELRAADGLIDLEGPSVYDYVSSRLREFLGIFPGVDEIVLTMTETAYPVFRRPFCDMPIAERVRRLLQSVTTVTDPLDKRLVVRPFSAVRADELHVREAVEKLDARNVTMMYKTEPFDWHPFLPDEELIGSVAKYEARAETDCGAEYYGQAIIPCSYLSHIDRRLSAGLRRGATVCTLRVDRGADCTALDHPINEANIIAPTRWLKKPGSGIDEHHAAWFAARYGKDCPAIRKLLEQTFEVMGKSLYIDGSAITHSRFPQFVNAKHVQAFALFEENVSLSHLQLNWGMLHERQSRTHEAILSEKREALELARRIVSRFDAEAVALRPADAALLRQSLATLPPLAEACLLFCRVTIAHLREMWKLPPLPGVGAFDAEAAGYVKLANEIAARHGDGLFYNMPVRMREMVDMLRAERTMEMPIRAGLGADPGVVDYVLCGFASEGHRLAKLLHSGDDVVIDGVMTRQTGVGEEAGAGYTLSARGHGAMRLTVTFVRRTRPAPAAVRVGETVHKVTPDTAQGPAEVTLDVPAAAGANGCLPVRIWSTTPTPINIARIVLRWA